MKKTLLVLFCLAITMPGTNFKSFTNAETQDFLTTIIWSNGPKINGFFGAGVICGFDDDRLYGLSYNLVYCMDASSGKVLWYSEWFDRKGKKCDFFEDKVFFYGEDEIRCYNKYKGDLEYIIEKKEYSNSKLINDKIFFLTNEKRIAVYVISSRKINQYIDLEKIYSGFLIQGNELLCIKLNEYMDMYDFLTMDIKWECDLRKFKSMKWPIDWKDGKIFFSNDKLCCVNAKDGNFLWQTKIDGSGKLSFWDGKVVSGYTCLDINTGEILWAKKSNPGQSMILAGHVYYYSINRWVIFELNTGEIMYNEKTNPSILRLNGAYYEPEYYKGQIFVQCSDGKVYCYGYKPEALTFRLGEDVINVGGRCIDVNVAPFFKNDELYVDATKIFEPLGMRFFSINRDLYYLCDGNKIVATMYPEHKPKLGKSIDEIAYTLIDGNVTFSLKKLAELGKCDVLYDQQTSTYRISRKQ